MIEKALAVGIGGVVSLDVRVALSGMDQAVHTVIAGLGGRPITTTSLHRLLRSAVLGELPEVTFLDLDRGLVERGACPPRRQAEVGSPRGEPPP